MTTRSCNWCGISFRRAGGYTWIYAGWLTVRICTNCSMHWESRRTQEGKQS